VAQAQSIAEQGVKEIVVSGINIGDFGQTTGEDVLDLFRALDDVQGIERYRISSIEPNLLRYDIIDFVAHSRAFLPHFHIPLQSGADEILLKMRRRYLTDLYADRVNYIKSVMPHACIGVDIMVGFPGETDALFQTTFDFLHALPVDYFHVFTYSERPNTTAVKLPDPVPMALRKQRTQELRQLSEKKREAFYQSQLGREVSVLWEAEAQGDDMFGFTENYIRVVQPYDPAEVNEIRPMQLVSIRPQDGLGQVKVRIQPQDLPEALQKRMVSTTA
jgi:threonylcarbamoyladenosine tRNA methylthiotransferase MtaB